MRFSFLACVLLLRNFAAAIAQESQSTEIAVQWHWDVVSTPDFYGPFRDTEPGFRNPTPKQPLPTSLPLAHDKEPIGIFEALLSEEGVTMPEQTIAVSSSETERVVNEILSKWRFAPATLDGKPIRVRLRVHLIKKIG
jgi:hypothetical protein